MEMSVEKFVSRRLHPVRVTVGYLSRELDVTKGEDITIDREMLESVVNTLEIFIGDFDVNFRGPKTAQKEKKFVESSKATVKV